MERRSFMAGPSPNWSNGSGGVTPSPRFVRLEEVNLRLLIVLPACIVLASGCALLFGQSPGVTAEWDIRKTIQDVIADTNRLRPVLEQIKPQDWVSKGAPQAYVGQWNSTRTQVEGLIGSAGLLSKDPEKISAALDTFFRLQTLELMLHSLAEGVRKYQNPALADLINGIVSEHGANRQRLQQYVVDLAATKEQEFAVIDKEAQRCRGMLSRQPPVHKPAAKAAPNSPEKK